LKQLIESNVAHCSDSVDSIDGRCRWSTWIVGCWCWCEMESDVLREQSSRPVDCHRTLSLLPRLVASALRLALAWMPRTSNQTVVTSTIHAAALCPRAVL